MDYVSNDLLLLWGTCSPGDLNSWSPLVGLIDKPCNFLNLPHGIEVCLAVGSNLWPYIEFYISFEGLFAEKKPKHYVKGSKSINRMPWSTKKQ